MNKIESLLNSITADMETNQEDDLLIFYNKNYSLYFKIRDFSFLNISIIKHDDNEVFFKKIFKYDIHKIYLQEFLKEKIIDKNHLFLNEIKTNQPHFSPDIIYNDFLTKIKQPKTGLKEFINFILLENQLLNKKENCKKIKI